MEGFTPPQTDADLPPGIRHRPLLLFAAAGVAIVATEILVMRFLLPQDQGGGWGTALLDGLALVLILCPVLYLLFYRPLLRHLLEKHQISREQARTLEQLSEREAHYRALFESNQAAILLIDPGSGEIVDCNPAAARFYGYASHLLKTRNIAEIDTLSPAGISGELGRAASGDRQHFNVRHRLADGSCRNVEVFSAPIRISERPLLYCVVHDVTGAARIAAELRESQERFRSIFQMAGAGMCTFDPQGKFLQVNPAFCTFLGLTESEVLQRTVEDVTAFEDLATTLRFLQEGREGAGREFRFEKRFRRGDGTQVWGNASTAWIRDGQGQPAYAVGLVQDITARKNAEQQLLSAHRTMEAIFAAAPLAIAAFGLDGRVLRWNPAAERIFGWRQEEILGKTYPMIPEERRQEFDRHIRDTLACLPLNGRETVRRHKDGSSVEVSITTAPLYDGNSVATGVMAIYEDIGERRRTREQLQSAREHLDQLVRSGPAVIYSARADEPFGATFVSDNVRDQLGFSPEEFTADPGFWMAGVHPEDGPRVSSAMECLRKTGHVNYEYRFRTRKGDYRWMFDEARLIVGEDGRPSSVAGFWLNITERKTMEVELHRAKERAEEASRAKGEFLANMSHEIRTPLNGVLGMTEIVLETELTADQRECLTMAYQSGRSLLALLNDILNFSRLEAGMVSLQKNEFELEKLLRESVKTYSVQAIQKGLSLELRLAPEVPALVIGDPARLRQVLCNLLANAIKFTEEGKVCVEVAAEDDGGMLRFSVRDTGIGIPADQQERIFNSFVQVDGSMTRRFGGSGLGLTISRDMVRLMGGRLWVESVPGQGSTFHFTAALEKVADPQKAPAPTGAPRVLVVDDHPVHLQVIEEQLKSLGAETATAENGPEALEKLRQGADTGRPFSAVFIDLVMPGMDGLQLGQAIRLAPALPSPRMILLTSGVGVEAARWKGAGFYSLLQKPVTGADLAQAIKEIGAGPVPAPAPLQASGGVRRVRILLVEDEPVNQNLARMILERRGHIVTVADNGARALERLGQAPFDLVLMDLQMPVMDGLEAVRRIRAGAVDGCDPEIPVIAMTAHAMPEDREECLAAGMSGYLTKPLDLRQFTAAVENLGKVLPLPSPAAAQKVVDTEEVLQRIDGNRQDARALWQAFRDDLPLQLQRLDALTNEGDPAVARAAHQLKGASAAAGAKRLQQAAGELERVAAETSESALLRATYEAVRQEAGAALNDLNRLINLDG